MNSTETVKKLKNIINLHFDQNSNIYLYGCSTEHFGIWLKNGDPCELSESENISLYIDKLQSDIAVIDIYDEYIIIESIDSPEKNKVQIKHLNEEDELFNLQLLYDLNDEFIECILYLNNIVKGNTNVY